MQLTVSTIQNKFKVKTSNGEKIKVSDILFDERNFKIKYLVCEYGHWLKKNKVLVSPYIIRDIDLLTTEIKLDIDSELLREAPGVDYNTPVSEEYENAFFSRYGFPTSFWMGVDLLGLRHPTTVEEMMIVSEATKNKRSDENHTRSVVEVTSYDFVTHDKEITYISDWIVDLDTWRIESVAVGGWLEGSKYVIPTKLIDCISWLQKEIRTLLTLEEVVRQKEFIPSRKVNRSEEVTEYDYYARPRESQSL